MAAQFVIFDGILLGKSTREVALLAIVGLAIGAMAIPEFDRKKDGTSWGAVGWQALSGAAGGAGVALLISQTVETVGISVLVGGFLGFLAHLWIKYV
jgi:hypothetical protein